MINTLFFQVNAEQLGAHQFALGEDIFVQRFAERNAQNDIEEFKMFGDDGIRFGPCILLL
jgi:hypothetical protein